MPPGAEDLGIQVRVVDSPVNPVEKVEFPEFRGQQYSEQIFNLT